MNGHEQVGLFAIGDGGASLERNEGIVLTGVDHVRTEPALQQFAEAATNLQNQVLFLQTIRADGSGVMTAVAGIDDNAADLKTKRADQGTVAAGGRPGFPRIDFGLVVAGSGELPGFGIGSRLRARLAAI